MLKGKRQSKLCRRPSQPSGWLYKQTHLVTGKAQELLLQSYNYTYLSVEAGKLGLRNDLLSKATRQSFHRPLPLKRSISLRSTVYLAIQAYKPQRKTSKNIQDQQGSQMLRPTALPWRDSLVTVVPVCSLCLTGSINLCLPILFGHPFPWNKGI